MTDIYDYYLYNFSKIYLREGKLAPKGVAIHKGPQDGRFYYSDGRSRDHTHNAQYISNRDIEVLEMVRSGTLNLENIGAYAILMLEKLGLVTEDEDGETILTDEGEQIKSPGIAILSRVDREEALLKNPLKSRKMVVDDQLLKELDGIKNYDPSNPHTIDRIRLFGEKIELYEGLGLINPIRGSARGLTNIGEKILNSNIGDVVSIPLPQDVSIRVPDDNHNATNNLNPLEESTVEWYKHRGYESINKALLSGDVSDTRTNNAICCLDNVLERHKIVNPQTVYSGVGSRVGNMLLSMDKGDTFQIDTYLSTSLRRATALTFSNSIPVDGNYRKVVLKINTPMNATGYYYGDTEEYDDEDEILFPRATQYILKSKEEKGEAIIITCDRIDKSTKATQVDNSRVYLQDGDKPPKGVIIHKGSRDPNARWYESNTRNKASGINRNELYLSDEDIAILNKFKEFNPTLNDASKKREMDRMVFGRRSDEPSLDDYLIRLKQKGPDMGAGEEVERMRKLSILGLITTTLYGWGFGYQLSDKKLLLDESGIYTFKANKREEILSANPIMQIPPQKDIFIDINKESHLKNGAFTEDEIDVINNYKLHDYHDINIGLITCDVSKKTNSDLPVADCICHLDNILSRCRLSGPAVVYNGASKKIGEMFYNGELAEGDIIQTDAFLSTSLKSEVAQGFCAAIDVGGVEHTVMLEISMPAESTGFYFGDDDVAYNDKINKSTKEYEVLLPRACQFKITGVNITDGDHGKIILVKCDRLSKDSAISHREIQADNSRVYLNPGEKAPQGATIYAGTRKRTARYYKTEEIRSKETYGRNVGHIYVAPEDLEALNKIQFFDPSLEEIKQKYFKDFPDTPDEIVMDFKDDYLERGPDLTDDEFDRLNRMTNVGLTYWDGRKYCITADGVEIRKPGVNLIKRYRREELIAQNAKTYGFISDKPEYPVDITREDHSQMPMSEGERSALTGYKGSLYKEINPALLGSGNLKMNLHRIANLDALLSRSVISSPTVTYNGTSSRIGEMLMSMAPGDMFQIDTYLSTSLSSGTAAGFSSDFYGSLGKKTSQVLLEISLPAGAHGFYFGENDNVDHPEGDQFGGPEREILLPRASQFRIDAIEKDARSDTYRDQYTVKVTLIVPPNLKEVIQADNSRVYLKEGEKPPKGVRLHKGIRKATARWYESQEYKKNMGENKLSRLLLKAMRKLKGKYAQPGTHERKSVQDVLKKIYGTYSIMQFVEDLNREHYPEFSNYNLTSYSEGDALKRLLPGMVSEIRSNEPLHAPLQYRDSSYDEVIALTKIKPGETFISKKWLPLYEDKEKARNATMNIYSDDEVKKIIFRVDASAGMEGVSYEDLLIGKENQPFEVTGVQDEEGIRTIDVKPLSNDQYGEKGVLPLGLPRSYYDKKAQELQERYGLNNIIKSLEGKPSLVFEDSEVELESIFGEYKGDYHLVSDKLQKIQQHQSHQAHNGNWFGDTALEGMSLLKMACDASHPLNDLTIYIPFDAVQAYKRPQSEDENSQVRERVEIVKNLDVGDTFKIRMNMVGSLSPDVANSRSTYQYTENRESKYGMITYRYKPQGNPEFDKGVVTSEGSVILQRNLNWKVVGIHDVSKGDMSHKVIDIEPVSGDEHPHYPGGEIQYTTIEPREFDPGTEGGSDGSFTASLVEKYDELGINAMDFSGDHHPDYDGNTLEGQAMASWCSGDYEEIGTYIRTGKLLRDRLSYPMKDGMDKFTPETILPYLDRYIETFPPMPEGLILYRGVGGNTAARMIKGLKVGDTCIDPCYMSFSDNPEVAWKFAKKSEATCDDDPKVFLRLVSKGGEHAALGNFSESEIVFGRNQKLKVVNISKANFDSLPADKGGNMQVYPTPVIVYDVEVVGDAEQQSYPDEQQKKVQPVARTSPDFSNFKIGGDPDQMIQEINTYPDEDGKRFAIHLLEMYKSNQDDENNKLYSIFTPDGKIGSIIFGEIDGSTLNIRDMASPISHKGYGKELFGKVEYMLGLSSIRKLKLYSNEGSYEFYNKIGLIPNDTDYLNELLSGKKWYKPLIFTKDISPV